MIELAGRAPRASVIELVGDVGAGKTTFVKGLAKALGVSEPVSSPSFTISKTYALPDGGNLVHYDFYRLTHSINQQLPVRLLLSRICKL